MSNLKLNQADYFPDLNIEFLKVYANRWANMFSNPPIIEIVLWRYYHKQFQDGIIKTKYAIVFTTEENSPDLDEAVKGAFLQKYSIPELEINKQFGEETYLNNPKKDFLGDWQFFTKLSDDLSFEKKSPGIKDKEPHVVLFQQSVQDKTKVLQCKMGNKWKDVKITLVSYEYVKIKTPQGEESYHFKEIGMRDGRTLDKPSDLWTLLGLFCKYSGRIDSETPVHGFKNLSKSISNLNKKLQKVFGIDEKFCHTYNEKNGWVSKCVFGDNIFSSNL